MKKFEERDAIIIENEGEKIFATTHFPIGVENPPMVIISHGFAGYKCGDWRLFVRQSEMLAKCGIASIRFDFRGCGESEGDWIDMTIGGEVSDLLSVLNYVDTLKNIDHKRVALLGKSLGGLISVLAAKEHGNIKTLALWAPAFHAKQWEQLAAALIDPEVPDEMKKQMMQFDGAHANEHFLKEFFTLRLEDHLVHLHETPIMHVHGLKDEKIDLSHAEEYERVREEAAARTHMIRLPNTDHEFAHAEEQAYVLEETTKWFVEHL